MKKTNDNNNNKKIYFKEIVKSIFLLLFFFALCYIIFSVINTHILAKDFAYDMTNKYNFYSENIFSIDKIYFFSSATADNNEQNKTLWDLNIHQFTDIALYINNNNSQNNFTSENTINSLSIENINFNNISIGEPNLYFKSITNFGKYIKDDNNLINNNLSFEILDNTNEINYELPQIHNTCDEPITLSYINSNIVKNKIITDISEPLTFNGSLLKKSGITISSISGVVSFDIRIKTNSNKTFVANVYFSVPLGQNDSNNVYSGQYIYETNPNIRFIRQE